LINSKCGALFLCNKSESAHPIAIHNSSKIVEGERCG
jgi:hypothetical protein